MNPIINTIMEVLPTVTPIIGEVVKGMTNNNYNYRAPQIPTSKNSNEETKIELVNTSVDKNVEDIKQPQINVYFNINVYLPAKKDSDYEDYI